MNRRFVFGFTRVLGQIFADSRRQIKLTLFVKCHNQHRRKRFGDGGNFKLRLRRDRLRRLPIGNADAADKVNFTVCGNDSRAVKVLFGVVSR